MSPAAESGAVREPTGFREQVEWLLIERSIAGGWILICLNVLMSVLFCVVYLTSLRDPMVVYDVLSLRLGASAVAGLILLFLTTKDRAWIWPRRRAVKMCLVGQELVILLVFGATATMWMGQQAYAVNATTVTGICAFAVMSGVLAPRDPAAILVGRFALLSPVVLFCVLTLPPLWWLLSALCTLALTASYGVAFALHGQHRRQAVLETRLRFARRSAARALKGEKAARASLEEEGALRERFLHAVTHDLGQPLHALKFHLRRLKSVAAETDDAAAAAQIEQFAAVATVSLVSANAIIDSVAGSAWLREDLAEAELSPLSVGALLAATAAEIEPLAEHHGLELRVVPTSIAVLADREFLERVVRNLVSNAVQHAQSRVVIGAKRRGPDAEIIVQDDGPGVPREMRQAIFEPFRQIRASARRDGGKVGLGLSIVRDLAQRMGGAVGLQSEEGRGARFSVRLAMATKDGAGASAAQGALSILIIDDDPNHVETTCAAVEGAGCRALVFDAGPDEGFEARNVADAIERHKGAVLLDLHLSAEVTAHDVLDAMDAVDPARIFILTSDQDPRSLAALRA
ncbi:MAG: HAMP domain-containing sensor histidine kinase, partial [Pseudomonadota bacterium]